MSDERPTRWEWGEAFASERGPENPGAPGTPMIRHVLHVLYRRMAADGGNCFPSVERIATESGLGRRTVLRCLSWAEENGWLVRESAGVGGQGWRRYRYLPAIPADVVPRRHRVKAKGGALETPRPDEGGATGAEGGATQYRKVVPPRHPSSSKKSSEENTPLDRESIAVFEYWRDAREQVLGRNGSGVRMKPTEKRISKVRARLREGYSVEQLKSAVDGCLSRPFNVENGHLGLELICRDQDHVERYLASRPKPNGPPMERL